MTKLGAAINNIELLTDNLNDASTALVDMLKSMEAELGGFEQELAAKRAKKERELAELDERIASRQLVCKGLENQIKQLRDGREEILRHLQKASAA
jgi:hypothetical protein